MIKREHSIAMRVSATLVIVTTALVGIMGAQSFLAERKQEDANLHTELELLINQLAVGLSLPLWNFDRPQVDRLMDSAMERQDVDRVEVIQTDATAPSGQSVYQRLRSGGVVTGPTAQAIAPPPANLLVAARDVLSPGGSIGKVRVWVTPHFLEARLRARLIDLIVAIVALDLLLILGLYVLLWRIVIKPLETLGRFAQAISGGRSPDATVAAELGLMTEGAHFTGELESLRSSIATTFELLEARYDALRKNEMMLSTILNSVPQSIFWKTKDGVYLGCNGVFATTVGVPDPAAVIGKTDYELPWTRAHIETYLADDRQVFDTAQPKLHIIEQLETADGRSLWVDSTKVPLRDASDQVYGVLGVYDDITERRRDEAKRLELEKQLRQSQKMEAIGTLASGIAHDFNNLLSAIRGNAELAALELPPEHPVLTSIAEIERASKRATDLVRQIVGFSRPEQGTMEIVDLRHLVGEVMRLMRSVLPAGIELTTRCGEVAPSVLADASQLHQVLVNLYTNAWQAIALRPGQIEVVLEQRALVEPTPQGLDPGLYACITVNDTGEGMAAEVCDRIFEPFFTTRTRGHGTGLGLSTVRGIVTAHHGAIEVESKVGTGTRFTIYLPAAQAQDQRKLAAQPAAEPSPRRALRVFYVDDEEALVFLVTRQLARRGHDVRGFTSAETALAAIKDAPGAFDVLVTDYNMPRMPGLKLIAEVLVLRPNARVVLTTGYLSDEIKAAAAELQLKWLIDKPSSVDELCEAINNSALAASPHAADPP